jgi:hypothetical protein
MDGRRRRGRRTDERPRCCRNHLGRQRGTDHRRQKWNMDHRRDWRGRVNDRRRRGGRSHWGYGSPIDTQLRS